MEDGTLAYPFSKTTHMFPHIGFPNRKDDVPGARCEIKNLNRVKFMTAAVSCDLFS
jgi:hypothetical protein